MVDERSATAHAIGVAAIQFERVMTQVVADELRPFNLTVTEFGILDHVSTNPGVTNAELARYLHMTPQALGRVTASLVGRDLISRSVDERNGRKSPIRLTVAGHSLLDRTRPAVGLTLDRLLHSVSDKDRAVTLRTLKVGVPAARSAVVDPSAGPEAR